MAGFQMRRIGLVMEPEPGNVLEVEGVLNPAAVRGPDGQLYLFPRLVARGNYSRIGIARVKFNAAGDPTGVERLGIALEPEADYERRLKDGGGCEDPRITFVEPIQRYVMTYTALSPHRPADCPGPIEGLVSLAASRARDLCPYNGIDFDRVDNKDASVFPVAVPNHAGKLQWPYSTASLSRNSSGGNGASPGGPRGGSPSRKHLDFLLPNGHGRPRTHITSAFQLASPTSQSGSALGAAQDRRRHPSDPDPARMVGHLPRRGRYGGGEHRGAEVMLLRRGTGALQGASACDPISFADAGADAGLAARTPGDRRQRRLSDRHRSARRPRRA